jgi:multiple sugar transport system permease protein
MRRLLAGWPRRRKRKEWAVALLFLAPSAIGFALFYVIPFALTVIYSFQDRTTPGGSFAGIANYRELLASSSFRKAAANTLLFTGVSVPLILGLSLLLALMLNRSMVLRSWLRTAYVLPLVVPAAATVMVWQILFDWNGTLNVWMRHLHAGRVDWMKSGWALGVVAIFYIWKNIGYTMILFLAGLQQIPRAYYETAEVEGAGRLRQLVHITLVYLTPTFGFAALMAVVNSFKVFRETYLIAGDYPHDSIYMLQHYMNNLFAALDMQKLTAAAALMAAANFVLVSAILAAERRFRNFVE